MSLAWFTMMATEVLEDIILLDTSLRAKVGSEEGLNRMTATKKIMMGVTLVSNWCTNLSTSSDTTSVSGC